MNTRYLVNKLSNLSLILTFLMTPLSHVAQAELGGISGGGGGVTNPEPANPYQIKKAAMDSKRTILAWLNERESLFKPDHPETETSSLDRSFRKLFLSNPGVFEAIQDIKLYLNAEGPCKDPQGNEVDGSVNPDSPGIICISTYTLSKKLTEYNYEYETTALVLHEISHILGSSEEEAVALQKYALHELLTYQNEHYLWKLQDIMSRPFNTLNMNANILEILGTNSLCSQAEDLMQSHYDFFEATNSDYFVLHPLRSVLRETNRSISVKISALRDYICGHDTHGSAALQAMYLGDYEKGFAGDIQVTARVYEFRTSGIDNEFILEIPIDKIVDDTSLKKEIGDILTHYKIVGEEVHDLINAQFEVVLQ